MDLSSVKSRLSVARDSIDSATSGSGLDAGSVRIMAVTKMHPPEVVSMAIGAGIDLIGENRVSEGGRKIRVVGRENAEFHLIGPVHRKELRQALRDFHSIDAVDRVEIASEIVRRISLRGIDQPGILLEVNTSGEKSKYGFPPDVGLLEGVLGKLVDMGLRVDGFLTVGPLGASEPVVRKAFSSLREIRDSLESSMKLHLGELSMGMSDDFHWAVMEGASTVRLGRFLFGDRPVRPG